MPSMGSSGGNEGARNRQRNFSVGSNVSSSTHKENRENLSNVADHLNFPVNWNMLSRNTARYPEQESARRYLRLESQNRNLESCEPEQDTKWQCESLLAQLEQANYLQSEPPFSRVEPPSRLRYQADSLRDTQQRLGRLQRVMSNKSTSHQQSVSQNGKAKAETANMAPGRSLYSQPVSYAFDSLANRSFTEQSSPSVRELYVQREHLLASSTEGSEQDPEFPDNHATLQNGLYSDQTMPNTQIHNLQDRVDRLERELQRTNFVCEILVREQRNLTSLMDSLAASGMTSSMDSTNSRPHSTGAADSNSSLTQQQMLLSLNQCCQMLMQLQRDFASMSCCMLSNQQQQQQRQTTAAAPPSPAAAPPGSNFDFPARERRNTGSDPNRQDPLPTLNNQVPPGTRTNNYWDNFRSYSRQNLLSTGSSSKAAAEADDADGSSLATPPGAGGGSHDIDNGTRTKRKVNKGQRQVEIGVHSPHADNRALAYGLRSVTQPDVTIRNLNPRIGNDASAVATTLDVKITKDTSGLMCSGARPKENRRTLSEPLDSEESDTSTRPAPKPQNPSAEQALQETLQQHAGNPRFLAELSQLLKKFDGDLVRPLTLSALQNVTEEEAHNPLVAAFTTAAQQHDFFTLQLEEVFFSSIQQDSDDEGAAALPLRNLALPGDIVAHIRHLLEPFLGEPLAQVQQHIMELLAKISFQGQPKEASTPTAPNDLAEADQVCDNDTAASQNWSENGRETQAAGLDEVPIRLPSGGGGANDWLAEDEFHDN